MTMMISQQAMDDLEQEIEATAQVDLFDPLVDADDGRDTLANCALWASGIIETDVFGGTGALGQMSVTEVMSAVGLGDLRFSQGETPRANAAALRYRQYFTAAFRKKFGISPREYLMQYRR